MKLTVTPDNKYLQMTDFDQNEVDQMYVSMKRRIKNYYFHPLVKKKLWDGYIEFIDNHLRIPAGLWNIVQKVCDEYSFPMEIDGLDRLINTDFDDSDFMDWVGTFFKDQNVQPRDYQIDAALKIIKWKRSISEIATSAGKTLIIFMVFAYLKHKGILNRMLIVVPTANLILQTVEGFEEYSNDKSLIKYKIQSISGGASKEMKDVDIVIGTYQSLRNLPPEFYHGVNVACVDEAHHVQTKSIKSILSMCKDADFRFGLSGTMMAGDDSADSYTIQSLLGPMVNKISPNFLTKNQFATPIQIKIVKLNYLPQEVRLQLKQLRSKKAEMDGAKLLHIEKQLIVENDARFEYVCNFISRVSKNTLVLFSNVKDEYGKRMFHRLRELTSDKEIFYVDGGTATNDRDYFKKAMEEGDNKILFASFGTFSTGISINNLHNVIFTEGWKSEKIVKQSIGRGMRLGDNKTQVNIIDFVDDFSCKGFKNYMMKHADERMEIYRREKFPYKVYEVNLNEG